MLGLSSGIGLVVASMVGVGVLTTTGWMAHDLGPTAILVAWLVGGGMAMTGALSYAAIAELIPRAGGEYRYLSDLLHPSVGYLAGWTSLLVGFSAPIALAAATAGPYTATLFPSLRPEFVALGLIALTTLLHALDLAWSKVTQNVLAGAKAVLLIGFVTVGLVLGNGHWPTWKPTVASSGFPLGKFAEQLVYVAFAYSGWNATVYAADEFRDARRTVPRSMLLGSLLVTVYYLLVNWVFVANLDAARLAEGKTAQTITIGHVVVAKLIGSGAARAMSVLVILTLFSAMSSMTMVGPRVYRAMARDGFLPKIFAGKEGRPPTGSVLLQSGLAVALLLTHSFALLMRNIGAILTLTSALTVASLLRVRFGTTRFEKPGLVPLVAAGLYIAASVWMLVYVLRSTPRGLLWIAVVTGIAAVAYAMGVGRKKKESVP